MRALCLSVSLLAVCLPTLSSPVLASETESSWTPRDGEVLSFDIIRKGKDIGDHTVTFKRDGDILTASNDVDIKVKFGPITAFRYEHDSQEVWKDGVLSAFGGETLRRGETYAINYTSAEECPEGATPFTHWNKPALMSADQIIIDRFEEQDFTVTKVGDETLQIGGQDLVTERFTVQAKNSMDIWYDKSGRWVRTAFLNDDVLIDYVLKTETP